VGVWVCGCVGVWVCGCVGGWVGESRRRRCWVWEGGDGGGGYGRAEGVERQQIVWGGWPREMGGVCAEVLHACMQAGSMCCCPVRPHCSPSFQSLVHITHPLRPTHTHPHTHARAHTHPHTHPHPHTYIHTHTHTHPHTHTPTHRSCIFSSPSLPFTPAPAARPP
jgi:hypothetical protein